MWSVFAYEKAHTEQIYPGVWFENANLSGLTQDQAAVRIDETVKTLMAQATQIHIGDKTYTPTLTEIGYNVNTPNVVATAFAYGRTGGFFRFLPLITSAKQVHKVTVPYFIDIPTLESYLDTLANNSVTNAQDIALTYKDNKVQVTPAVIGSSLQKNDIAMLIQAQIKPGTNLIATITPQQVLPTLSTETQVASAKAAAEKLTAQPLTVQVEDTKVDIPPDALFSFLKFQPQDKQLAYTLDNDKIKAYIDGTLAKKIDISPIAKHVLTTDKSTIGEGRDGRKLNRTEATKLIAERLQASDFSTPLTLPADKVDRSTVTEEPEFLTDRAEGKYIDISLKKQTMHLIDNHSSVAQFRVSTGKWSTPTPTGEFTIMNHYPVAYSKAFSLYMPNWMAIRRVSDNKYIGDGIHGLPYWKINGKIVVEGQNHIGTPVSHGCIRLGPGDDTYVYNWAQDNDTLVFIHN